MTSNKDIEPTHYGTDYSFNGISDNDLWIENSSQISKEKYVQDNCIKSSPTFRLTYKGKE